MRYKSSLIWKHNSVKGTRVLLRNDDQIIQIQDRFTWIQNSEISGIKPKSLVADNHIDETIFQYPTNQTIKPVSKKIPFDNELIYSEPIPQYYKENHPWEIRLVSAPDCPANISVIRLIKTAPFNFEFRHESLIYHKTSLNIFYKQMKRNYLISRRYYMRSHLRNQKVPTQGIYFLIGLIDPTDKAWF